MRPINCLVYGGTSSLVASLLCRAPPNICFTLLSRKESERDEKKLKYLKECVSIRSSTEICFYDEAIPTGTLVSQLNQLDYDVVLVLTTHPNPAALTFLKEVCQKPILYIGSGSVTDAQAGRIPWIEYSLNKLWPEMFASLTLRCGFFIPDIEGEPAPPAGIGMESAQRIFGVHPIPHDVAWLSKKMYVTPISSLIQAICNWINTPEPQERLTGIFHFGTQHPLSRAYLRTRADLGVSADFVHDALTPVYEEEWTKSKKQRTLDCISDTMTDVDGACKRARAWISKM